MNIHPILFSTPMVEAILSGQKTQTRREVKPQNFSISDQIAEVTDNGLMVHFSKEGNGTSFMGTKNKFGRVGHMLWVRETFFAYGTWIKNGKSKKGGKQKWEFIDFTEESFSYKYLEEPPQRVQRGRGNIGWYKRPSLFMPKKACRIFLQITSIRVERLNSISENDAIAEGIASDTCQDHLYNKTLTLYKDYLSNNMKLLPASVSFKTLWQSINGMNSWASNPWVWVIEFKRIEKPENFIS